MRPRHLSGKGLRRFVGDGVGFQQSTVLPFLTRLSVFCPGFSSAPLGMLPDGRDPGADFRSTTHSLPSFRNSSNQAIGPIPVRV